MDERTNTVPIDPNKEENPKLRLTPRGKAVAATALVAGVTALVVGPQMPHIVEAAQRILNPEPSATAEAAPQSIAQQDMNAMIDKARATSDPHIAYGTDIVIGPDTHLYDEALAQISPQLLAENKSNIQAMLLESSKTADTDQPDAPYITHEGQVYTILEGDYNHDGLVEFVLRLKPSVDEQLPLPSAYQDQNSNDLASPTTH